MTHRSTMPRRPWLTGATYDKYDTPNVVHFDLYAYTAPNDDFVYFEVIASSRGKTVIAYSLFRTMYAFGIFDPIEASRAPADMVPVRWTRQTHDDFKRVHGRLLALCGVPPGYSARTILCHYVKPYDADPWPRGTLNTYTPPTYGEGKRPGRPRRIDPKDAQAINILMGVDVLNVL